MAQRTYSPRLKVNYRQELIPKLQQELGLENVMQVPRPEKIVVNMGVGEASRDARLLEGAVKDLTTITGQKPTLRSARKSLASFKIRRGMPIGAAVTMRGDRMWEFLDRLMAIVLPRIRDFRGLNDVPRGMDITIVTTAQDDEGGKALLSALGFPFRSGRLEA
jgi:large subunit ribosomal protein L5